MPLGGGTKYKGKHSLPAVHPGVVMVALFRCSKLFNFLLGLIFQTIE